MATNRLDLGRVRGYDGANGHPAVVEVLEETAKSYVLGITYYDDEGVEHVIQTPNLKGGDGSATYTVASDADLQKWMNAGAGNDYTCVLVKPAAYTLSGTIDLAWVGTEAVIGFGASLPQVELHGSGSEMVIGLEAKACTDVLLVAADGSVRCSNLRGELWTLGAAENLAVPATAANYNKVRFGQAEIDTQLIGPPYIRIGAGIQAPYNPSNPNLNVVYFHGGGYDYVLNNGVGISTAGFEVPTYIRRVLASEYNGALRLHILTRDGRLFYATNQGRQTLSYVELVDGLPPEPLTDIAYDPETDWSSATPFPAMLTATRFYNSQKWSDGSVGGKECYYVGRNNFASTYSAKTHLVRENNNRIRRFSNYHINSEISNTPLPADAVLCPAELALLIKTSSFVKVIKGVGASDGIIHWTDYAIDDPTNVLYTPQVRFSPDVFPDGFSASVLFNNVIVGRSFGQINTGGNNWSVPLFMTTPRVLDGKLTSLVMVQEDFQSSPRGDFYAKLVVWEGLEVSTSGAASNAGDVLALGVNQSNQSVIDLKCVVLKDHNTYSATLDVRNLATREASEHKVGVGFTEKDATEGVEILKMADGTQVVPRKVMYPDVFNPKNGQYRWLRFDPNNHKALIIQKGVTVNGNVSGYDVVHEFAEDTSFDLGTLSNGVDYYAVLTYDGKNFGMTAKTAAQLAEGDVVAGRFHTVCVDYGDSLTMTMRASPDASVTAGTTEMMVKPYREETDPDFYAFYKKVITAVTSETNYKVVTCAHPLVGYKAGEIIPESIWCKDFFPVNLVDDAVAFDQDTGKAIDIYLQSGKGTLTRSAYNAGAAVHTVNRTPLLHSMDMADVGKSLLTDWEFTCAAKGSNEMTNIAESSDKTYVGGHIDTASHRMVSAIGCEEMCGYLWQWLDELGPVGDNTSGWTTDADSDAKFGQSYVLPYVLLAGGNWYNGVHCGSVARNASDLRSSVNGSDGGRGSSRVCRGGRYSA